MANRTPPHTWHSPQKLANWTLDLLAIHILILIVSIVSTWLEINLIQSMEDGKPITESAFDSNDTRQTIVVVLFFVSYVAVAISFLIWISRASKNLSALGTSNQKFSPGWAIAWWFIPIACLWKPYNVTAEIWVESHPDRLFPPAWVTVWWAAWILSAVLQIYSSNTYGFMLRHNLEIASDIFQIAAGLCLVFLVYQITAHQINKHQATESQNLL